MPNPLPLLEATSALAFSDLLTSVALKLGVASYGSTGTGVPGVPVDARNLSICQTLVNDAIRMVIADAPPESGWFWTKPVSQVDLWPAIGPDFTGSTYVSSTSYNSTNSTIHLSLTVPMPLPSTVTYPLNYVPNFVQSMEQRTVWLGGQPSTGTIGWFVPPNSYLSTNSTVGTPYTVYTYDGPFDVDIYVGSTTGLPASLSSFHNKIPFSFASQGDYTLPANFGGEIAGEITYIAQTNRGMILHWTDETNIRIRRQNFNIESGTPWWAAVRPMSQPNYSAVGFTPSRRRWELMTWRIPSEFLSVLFPYNLAFNNLVNPTDLPPSPISFDDTILAACRAQAERYMLDSLSGPDWQYYKQSALPNALKVNARGANRTIGYNGSGLVQLNAVGLDQWRQWWYQRPAVGIVSGPGGAF